MMLQFLCLASQYLFVFCSVLVTIVVCRGGGGEHGGRDG